MILSICQLPEVLKVFRLIKIIITILKIAVPIILIVSVMLDYLRAVKDNDELSKMSKLVVTKLVAALLVFFIPTFVSIIVNTLGSDNTYAACLVDANEEKINDLYIEMMEKYMEGARTNKDISSYYNAYNYLKNIKDDTQREAYVKELGEIKKEIDKKKEEEKPTTPTEVKPGIFKGTPYNVSEEDLQFLANVGYCEQGQIDGIKAEISLAANLFELQSKYSTLIDYVKKSGWFACAKTNKVASKEAVEAVRDVVINGNRTLPLYINEHDCYNCSNGLCSNGNRGDICKLVVNGKTLESLEDIKNRNNYIPGQTVIYNKYGGVYTFYSFPCEKCDPFGYTASAYKKRGGESTTPTTPTTPISDSGTLKVYFLGLGRYDGFLIIGNNTTLFIDGGYISQGKKAIEFIKSLGITKIDGLIGSHLHNNHIDAHKEFIKELNIGRVYYDENPGECLSKNTCIKGDSDTGELMNLINSKNIPMTILKPGKDVRIGNLYFDIVAPDSLKTTGRYRENYNSLNMILKFGKNKFYFSGDHVRSSDILKKYDTSTLDVDVFKWPHHGQESVSNKFLDALTPKYIIVPNTTVKDAAQSGINYSKAKGYATGTDGYILIESDGKNLNVNKVNTR